MSSRRFIKKTIYATGFLVFIALFIGIFAFLLAPPAPPVIISEDTEYEEVEIEDVSVIHHEDSVDIVVRLRNPNVRAGVVEYPLIFTLLDRQEREITAHREETYLLPGSVQYAAALNIPVGRQHVSRVSVKLPESPVFSEVPAAIGRPSFSSFVHEREIRLIGGKNIEEQRGIVRNTGTFDWNRVEIIGVALSNNGEVVGVGKTFVGELKTDEQRAFTLQWPAPQFATDRVIILPSTNIYLEENVIRVIGDPSTLR